MSWAKTLVFLLLLIGPAVAQTSPGFIDGAPLCANYPNPICQGAVPVNPLSLNQAFMGKVDYPLGPFPADGAWTIYTPTATFSTAPSVFTTANLGRWKQIGTKTYFVKAGINITSLGPGAGLIILSLPNSSMSSDTFSCSGVDATAGTSVQFAATAPGSAVINIVSAGGMMAHEYHVFCTYEAL